MKPSKAYLPPPRSGGSSSSAIESQQESLDSLRGDNERRWEEILRLREELAKLDDEEEEEEEEVANEDDADVIRQLQSAITAFESEISLLDVSESLR